jgi:ferredoxin-NADP reductase
MSPADDTQGDRGGRVLYRATIERILERAPHTRSLWLRLPQGRHLGFLAGQFISCELPIGVEPILRPYSIAASADEGSLVEICFDLVPEGPGSRYLFSLVVGATVSFTGPWGLFTIDRPPESDCVFVASGTGIVPIRRMIARALEFPGRHPLKLLYGEASLSRLLYREDFEAWARDHSRFEFAPILQTGKAAADELFAEVERRYVIADSNRRRYFYVCGIGNIVVRLRDLLRSAGYERRAVNYEKW